jgi:uncharacterized Zn finger protein
MDPLPKVTEASIRQHASADSYHRGREYHEQGAVLSLVRRDQQLHAEVEGSQYEPYRVQITYDAGGIAQALCSCPYDWGGWCKHIVATLLATLHSPATVEEGRRRPAPTPSRQQPSMQTLLAGLEREQLQALLLHLVEQQPALADVVEAQVHRVGIEPAADASAPQERRTPVDPNVFRRQVRTILRSLDRMRSSEAYWHVGAVVNEVRQVLEQAQGFVAAGDGHNALAILEAITEAYVADWAALIAFRGAPELAAYQRVQELAEERWPELRTELLAHLRQGRAYVPQGAIEIFLYEGLVEDAMRAVKSGASYTLLAQVVDAAIPSHADWAIQICRQQAEPIMQQGQSQHYHHAARWLEKARAAYRTAGREKEWQAYLAEIMTRYRRKYSLMPRLEALRR